MTAIVKPTSSATRPTRIRAWSLLLMPSETLMIAAYSGPTTIAPTTRICEFVKIPTAAMRPAIASKPNQLGG